MFYAVKRWPKLKSRYKERVEKAIEYAKSIEDWDNLVDPRTLTFYCLGLEPSTFVLHNIDIEEKRVSAKFVSIDSLVYIFFFFYKCFPLVGMANKFDKDMNVKMRSKKDESLSNLGKRTVRITEKGPPATPGVLIALVVTGTKVMRTGSLTTSVEEIPTPTSKRP